MPTAGPDSMCNGAPAGNRERLGGLLRLAPNGDFEGNCAHVLGEIHASLGCEAVTVAGLSTAPGEVEIYHSAPDGGGLHSTTVPLHAWADLIDHGEQEDLRTRCEGATWSQLFPVRRPDVATIMSLELHGKVVGSLNLGWSDGKSELPPGLDFPAPVLAYLALLVENRRLSLKEKQRASHMRLLRGIDDSIRGPVSYSSAFQQIIDQIQEEFGFYHLSLFLAPNGRRELELVAYAGAYSDMLAKLATPICWPVTTGMLGKAFVERRSVLANDVSKEPAYVPVDAVNDRSEVSVPLLADDECHGVLDAHGAHRGAFDAEAVLVLETIAARLAAAVVHLRDRDRLQGAEGELHSLRRQVGSGGSLGGRFIGQSEPMRKVVERIASFAQVPAPVLLTGETGTGKDIVAQSIHYEGQRRDGPFVAVNCASIPESLIEAELFGHERGAFTGAHRQHVGCFEQADGGTLFLDEIADATPAVQVKLLRVLEDGCIRRVGGAEVLRVDVRIVAATNRDPIEEVSRGRFREDLYYRLNVLRISLPPLRDRREDIPLLAHHFLQEACRQLGKQIEAISPTVLRRLAACTWPGNIRELRSTIERAVVMEHGPTLYRVDLQDNGDFASAPSSDAELSFAEAKQSVVEAFEKRYLDQILSECQGHLGRAARRAGIDRKTLFSKMDKHGINRQNYRSKKMT